MVRLGKAGRYERTYWRESDRGLQSDPRRRGTSVHLNRAQSTACLRCSTGAGRDGLPDRVVLSGMARIGCSSSNDYIICTLYRVGYVLYVHRIHTE